jgi:hypothetical protein
MHGLQVISFLGLNLPQNAQSSLQRTQTLPQMCLNFFNQNQCSPFWSYLVVEWFIQDTLQKASCWKSAQVLERADELTACLSLLLFMALRLRRCDSEDLGKRSRKFISLHYLPMDSLIEYISAIRQRITDKLRQVSANPGVLLPMDCMHLEKVVSSINRLLEVFEDWAL